MEVWKDIRGYEGIYQISNLGRIKSLHRDCRNGRILNPAKNNSGYLRVALSNNGKIRYDSIHRLVAEAFISNPKKLPEVNHIDGNKLNNSVENLEWVTKGENQIHAYKTGLRKITERQREALRTKYKNAVNTN